MAQVGSPAIRPSSCQFGCSPDFTGGSFWKGWQSCTRPGNCSSSAPMPSLPTRSLWCVPAAAAQDRLGRLRQRTLAGPKAVLAYLSRYTHRIAISNSRLIRFDADNVTFRVKNYRASKRTGRQDHHDLGDIRVHPPVPDPRPAQRPAPHPPCSLQATRGQHRQDRRAFSKASQIAVTPMTQKRAKMITRTEPLRCPAHAAGRVDQCRYLGARPTLQSTAKTTKGRSMRRAPDITNDTFSRSRCHLRTHHHALIKLLAQQKAGGTGKLSCHNVQMLASSRSRNQPDWTRSTELADPP